MKDYFKIEGPAVISFSGGRTSGYMLWRILQAHNGTLPDDVKVIFANTGKEMPETLDFVRDCGVHWNVPITWVEYRQKADGVKQHQIVTYETASRNGEPFEFAIRDASVLPNPVARYCTKEMKIRTIHRVMRGFNFDEWTVVIGIRADESRRIAKFVARKKDITFEEPVAPLNEAGIDVNHVSDFWKNSTFDLKLPNNGGTTALGNCDLCFLKGSSKILSIIRQKPELATWWIKQEEHFLGSGRGNVFRSDRPSYASMQKMAYEHGELFAFDDEPLQDCACTD